jgi:precorrin-2 dehydrogenase/sirohydrochlorin ferrochelatase
MRYYPIFLDLRGRHCLVVGGGKVAERKVRKLLRAGAEVRVLSPECTPGLQRLSEEGKIQVTRRKFRPGDLRGRAHGHTPLLVFAATDDPKAQQAIRESARAASALVNRADDAADSDFLVPASFTRGNLHVAISTSGTHPAWARQLRRWLAREWKGVAGRAKKAARQELA